MTATLHTIPVAPPSTDRGYNERLLGRRVVHQHYRIYGRLSGDYRYDRGTFWLEAECETGRYWWSVKSIDFLGPIPMTPCPKGNGGTAA